MTTETCSGGCHCGAVRFAASGEPKIVERCQFGDDDCFVFRLDRSDWKLSNR